MNAMNEYFMSKMNVRRRQVVIDIDSNHSAIIQAGAMQWMAGNVQATSESKELGIYLEKQLKELSLKKQQSNQNMLVRVLWF